MKFTFAPESKPLDGYTIKRAIYRGGFGEVYYALTDAGREVALKLLQNNTEIELRGVQQCLNLSHPNLVTIFDIRQDQDGDHWIVMEYVPGETLDRAVRRHPQGMPMEEVRKWFPGMAAGVQFLHDQGLVHRDLKPANVFSDSGCVKVGDVGLSKFITPSRRSAQTQSVGTVYYMAPEVAKGRYGKEVDIYALGVILYEMLTGKAPFDGDSTGEILMKHLTEQPDLEKLPPRIRPVIGRALEKDPARRFSTVSSMASAFEDAVLGRALVREPQWFSSRDTAAGAGATRSPRGAADRERPPQPAAAPRRSRWVHPHPPTTVSELASSLFGWLVVASVFAFLGVRFMVPVALFIAAIFGTAVAWLSVTGVFRYLTRTLFSVVWGVDYAARSVQRVAVGAAFAGGTAARAAVSLPLMAGRAVRWISQFVERGLRGRDAATSLTPLTTRIAHWTGSAALAPAVIGLLVGLMTLAAPLFTRQAIFSPLGQYAPEVELGLLATFGLSALLAAWTITGVCKFWEGRSYAPLPRRACLAVAGLGLGAGLWHIQQFLAPGSGVASLLASPQSLRMVAYNPIVSLLGAPPEQAISMVLIGLLFGLRSWSRQTSEVRPSRVRVVSVLGTAALAAVIAGVCDSNPEVFMAWSAIVSATVQLCSVQRPQPTVAPPQAA